MSSQNNLLKEVYEKGRVKKLATDGQNEMSDNVPPFMKGRRSPNSPKMKQREVVSDAAKRRLAKMKSAKKPGVGDFGGPGDGVHTKRTGK